MPTQDILQASESPSQKIYIFLVEDTIWRRVSSMNEHLRYVGGTPILDTARTDNLPPQLSALPDAKQSNSSASCARRVSDQSR